MSKDNSGSVPFSQVTVSKMELAKALKAVRAVSSSDEEYERVKALIVPRDRSESVGLSVKGLSQEDEFALMCQLMGTATHLVPLEQRPLLSGQYLIPDFLARFQPGCSLLGMESKDSAGFKCLVEVKSTKESEYAIGGAQLTRRRNFAETFGLPLLFAVRFFKFGNNALWIIVEDADRQSSTLKVSFREFVTGIRHVLWDEHLYCLRPGVYFRGIYDTACREPGVVHPVSGTQREFQVVADRQDMSFPLPAAVFYYLFFEAFHLKVVKEDRRGTVTKVVFKPQLLFCSMADVIYTCMRLILDERGQPMYDPTRVLAHADQNPGKVPFDKAFIERLAAPLFGKQVLGRIGIGDEKTLLERWRRYGGKK